MSKLCFSPDKMACNANIVTIGTFDGVHRGHKALLSELVSVAYKMNFPSVVYTFSEHPRTIFQNAHVPFLLNTPEEKKDLLAASGVDAVYLQKFTTEFANMDPEFFVRTILIEKLCMKAIVVGHDHAFGKNRSGNLDLLYELSKKYDFKIFQTQVLVDDGVVVSSTKIRNLLVDGDLAMANDMLGYNFRIRGKVTSDHKIGRELGFPTANIIPEHPMKLIPKSGVYIINAFWGNEKFQGIMNIGNRPTFEGFDFQIEAHLFDFDRNLYDEILEVEMLHRVRDEKKFENQGDLISAIESDKEKALRYFGRLC